MAQLIELLEHHIQGLDDVAACTVAIRSALAVGDVADGEAMLVLSQLGTVQTRIETSR